MMSNCAEENALFDSMQYYKYTAIRPEDALLVLINISDSHVCNSGERL
jgi:hypothetical protein